MEGFVCLFGYWVIGGKRLILLIINLCVICRKFRCELEY